MIHRQEKRSLFGFAVSRHIDLEDAQTIIAAIKNTPADMPIDFVIHTPGGLVLAAMQIARAVQAHKAKVTVYVPVYAMSGGTLIALAADEIVLGEFLDARSDRSSDCWTPGREHCQSPRLQAPRRGLRSHAGSR
jgi:ClpP class serine protease